MMGKIEMKPRTVVLGREVCVIIVVRSYEHYVNFGYGDVQWLPVISPPGSFATNQLATKSFILSINTEVDNKRATLNAHVFFQG